MTINDLKASSNHRQVLMNAITDSAKQLGFGNIEFEFDGLKGEVFANGTCSIIDGDEIYFNKLAYIETEILQKILEGIK